MASDNKSSIAPLRAHATRNRAWAEKVTDPDQKAALQAKAEEFEARVAEILNRFPGDNDTVNGLLPLNNGEAYTGVSDAVNLAFSLERDLQRALRLNLGQLEEGLEILDGGKEQTCASGRIDILARDRNGAKVVIELKAGTAELNSISQVLSYVGDNMSDEDRTVRGIVVANDFSPPAISAARASSVLLLKYSFKFSFRRVGVQG